MEPNSETPESLSVSLRSEITGRTRFPSGGVFATPGAIENLSSLEMSLGLTRHLQGDWGELDPEDKAANDRALEHDGRLVSAYRAVNGTRFWIITEADRSSTTILLPREY